MPRHRRDRPERHLSPLERTVYEAIVDVTAGELDDITPDSRLTEDLGLNDLDVVELAMLLEERLQIDVGDHVLDTWTAGTVRDVLKEIERCQRAKATAS